MRKKKINALNKLHKVKKYELDEKRQALIELQRELQKLYNEAKELKKKEEAEIEAAREDHQARLNLPIFLQGLHFKQNILKQKIYQLADFMIPIEESVKEAFRAVKSLEFVVESLHHKAQQELDRLEQQTLDELNLQRKNVIEND